MIMDLNLLVISGVVISVRILAKIQPKKMRKKLCLDRCILLEGPFSGDGSKVNLSDSSIVKTSVSWIGKISNSEIAQRAKKVTPFA